LSEARGEQYDEHRPRRDSQHNVMVFGICQVDDIKLKKCAACKSIRYCSVTCQREHRPQHKADCKKRVAELRDEILFRQPESSHLGDCPICLLPLSLDVQKSPMQSCCSKVICNGCMVASILHKGGKNYACPFCRHEYSKDDKTETDVNVMKRIEVNDPVAIRESAIRHGKSSDLGAAMEYYKKAAALGDAEAHYQLGMSYTIGRGVERDAKKEKYHMEEAAIGGHPAARDAVGIMEMRMGNQDRAMKHFTIAATLGHDGAMDSLRMGHALGGVRKEDVDIALGAYQAAVDATKSPQRDIAEKYLAEFAALG